jgi:SAM-dependent methyltransferase
MSISNSSVRGRSSEQILEHYVIEKELAERLRNAPAEERPTLYRQVYEELFRRVPHHPLTENAPEDPETVAERGGLLRGFLSPGSTYLEIGPGSGSVARLIQPHASRVFLVDVTDAGLRGSELPPRTEFFFSDGLSVPVPRESIDLAFSDQVMEHLHPDDALSQLRQIYDAMKPAGRYVCFTPSRLTGPHDISRGFDETATGLHLKEYTIRELNQLFRSTGFSSTFVLAGGRGRYFKVPTRLAGSIEMLLESLPRPVRRRFHTLGVLRALLGVKIVAVK